MNRDELARHIARQCYADREPMHSAYDLLSELNRQPGALGDVARRLPAELTPEIRFFRLVRRYIDDERHLYGRRPLHLSGRRRQGKNRCS